MAENHLSVLKAEHPTPDALLPLQPRIPRFRIDQFRQIGVGVFPQIEEFLIVFDSAQGVALLLVDFVRYEAVHFKSVFFGSTFRPI